MQSGASAWLPDTWLLEAVPVQGNMVLPQSDDLASMRSPCTGCLRTSAALAVLSPQPQVALQLRLCRWSWHPMCTAPPSPRPQTGTRAPRCGCACPSPLATSTRRATAPTTASAPNLLWSLARPEPPSTTPEMRSAWLTSPPTSTMQVRQLPASVVFPGNFLACRSLAVAGMHGSQGSRQSLLLSA